MNIDSWLEPPIDDEDREHQKALGKYYTDEIFTCIMTSVKDYVESQNETCPEIRASWFINAISHTMVAFLQTLYTEEQRVVVTEAIIKMLKAHVKDEPLEPR